MRNDNDDNDYAHEEGVRRYEKSIKRALINNDRDYPDYLHEQDVRSRFIGCEEFE